MARTGRKQLAVQILDDSFRKLEEIKQETGLSNAKIIEMLLDNYTNTNTNTNTNTSTFVTEERVAEMIKAALGRTNTGANTKPEPESKQEVRLMRDETGEVWGKSIDLVPEWQKVKPTTQDFYGKIPKPHGKGEYDHDPLRYLDEE